MSFSAHSSRAKSHRQGSRDQRDRDRNRDRDHRPASLPSRPPSRGPDSYRPPARHDSRNQSFPGYDSRATRNGDYAPPPPPPHLPPPPPPPFDSARPPQGDFTFRVEKPPGVEDNSYDSYRPEGGQNGRQTRRGRYGDLDRASGRGARRGSGRGARGGGFGSLRFLAANRPILQGRLSTAPEQAFYDADASATYRPLDELSDSDEAEMDISGDEESDTQAEPSSKRLRISMEQSASDSNQPKWSNPDPYTALPPPDTSQLKKKDVVQLIRKARVSSKDQKATIPSEAEDFISCDFGDSDSDDNEIKGEETIMIPRSADPPGVPGAPTGPRAAKLPFPDRYQPSGASAAAPPDNKSSADTKHSTLPDFPNGSPPTGPRQSISQPPAAPTGKKGGKLSRGDTDPVLGSRKRTYDDQIILPAHARLKKANKMPVRGSLTPEWRIKDGEIACPWIGADHSNSANMGVRLHKEVVDFYEHIKPRAYEETIRREVVKQLKAFCRSIYRDAEVYPFGSFPSGLYLPTGDMDLVFCSDSYRKGGRAKYNSKAALFRLRSCLCQNKIPHMNEVELILHAKVPLVKYIDRRTGLKMDISFENLTGVEAIEVFMAWKEQYPAMPALVTLIKHFLFMRGLNEPVNGGIGGFSVICLVVSMLQLMPEVQSRNLNPSHHLGDLLLAFFDLYGNRFNYKTTAISLNPPKYIPKNAVTTFAYKNPDRLSIVDPNNPENDIAGGSSNTATIMTLFAEAHRLLSERMATMCQSPSSHASILEVIFAGDYSTFRNQRTHLLKISQQGLPAEKTAQETVDW